MLLDCSIFCFLASAQYYSVIELLRSLSIGTGQAAKLVIEGLGWQCVFFFKKNVMRVDIFRVLLNLHNPIR